MITAYVAVGLWEARNFIAVVLIVLLLVILTSTLSYVISSDRRGAKLDEQTRLTRSHWSYSYRGLWGAGIGTAAGSLIAYGFKGSDPTGGLIAGLTLASFARFAHIVWYRKSP
ncbi:MAG: hypothetical protein AB8C95_04630 [Phycisphaeraceae bacterium]